MQTMPIPLLIITAIALIILLIAASRIKRGNPLAALAKKLGLALKEEHDHVLEHSLREFSLSGLGKVFPRLFYVLSGPGNDVNLKIFDYNGSTAALGMPHFLFQTMGFGEIAGKAFSHFLIAPKSVYWRLRLLFSKDVFVKTGLPRKFLDSYVMVLKTGAPQPKLRQELFDKMLALKHPYSLEASGNRFIFYRRGIVIPLKRMEAFYKDLQEVSDVLRLA